MTGARTALVLAGGGARGAYEAGVIRYLRGAARGALGAQPRIDIALRDLIGAVNACFLAAARRRAGRAGRGARRGLARAPARGGLPLERAPARRSSRPTCGAQLRATRPRQRSRGGSPTSSSRRRSRASSSGGSTGTASTANVSEGHVHALTVTATDLGTGAAGGVRRDGRGIPARPGAGTRCGGAGARTSARSTRSPPAPSRSCSGRWRSRAPGSPTGGPAERARSRPRCGSARAGPRGRRLRHEAPEAPSRSADRGAADHRRPARPDPERAPARPHRLRPRPAAAHSTRSSRGARAGVRPRLRGAARRALGGRRARSRCGACRTSSSGRRRTSA